MIISDGINEKFMGIKSNSWFSLIIVFSVMHFFSIIYIYEYGYYSNFINYVSEGDDAFCFWYRYVVKWVPLVGISVDSDREVFRFFTVSSHYVVMIFFYIGYLFSSRMLCRVSGGVYVGDIFSAIRYGALWFFLIIFFSVMDPVGLGSLDEEYIEDLILYEIGMFVLSSSFVDLLVFSFVRFKL